MAAAGAAIASLITGCGDPNAGEIPANAPQVPVQSMEDIGKLTPEQEMEQLRKQDTRPQEDRQESGL